MVKRLVSWACVALAGAAPLASRADASAAVRLSNFGYSLIDLDPGDGIAPWVRFEPRRFDNDNTVGVVERAIGPDGLPVLSFLILGAIVQVCSVIYLTLLIFAGARLAAAFRRHRKLSAVGTGFVGAAFIGFGAKLAGASLR
jgi:hypothetical protein